ncbi:hypothetical protein IAT38_001092 [Cryptococcus sp. DSM 104549]
MSNDHGAASPLVPVGDDSRPEKKQKRQTPHVSRACDRCRKRKTRCNGEQPSCDVCTERGWQCVYEEEDKRKTNRELEDLKARVAALERLVVKQDHGSSSSGSGSVQKSSAGSPTPTTAVAVPPEPSPHLVHKPPHAITLSFVEDGQAVLPNPIQTKGLISPTMVSPTFVSPNSGTASSASRPMRTLPRHNSMMSQGTAADLMRTDDESYDRLQRTEDGPLIQYGATSIWTHEHQSSWPPVSRSSQTHGPSPTMRTPGEWLDWSRNLPPGFVKDKAVHDAALDHFAAYYAPWCMTVDMPPFLQDMELCCTVGADGRPPAESRTPFYSPLLHCAVLFLGLYLLGGEWPEKINDNHDAIMMHCMRLLGDECDVPSLSSLRGINLWSSCMNLRPAVASGSNLGYTWYAMTYGMIQVLGININRGRMEEQELIQRDATFWTMYLQDILRAVAVGRPPMLATINPPIPYPRIEKEVDDIPWMAPSSPLHPHNVQTPGADLNGLKGMRSTVFHWSCRLGVLLTAVMEALYSPWSDSEIRDHAITQLDPQLEEWYATQPIQSPALHPLPHILVMHMAYHLTVIFLYRPFYRSASQDDSLSPADKCNRAAKSVLSLLQLFDSLHTIRCGPLTFMNIIFSTSTIFLLKAVEDQCSGLDMTSSLQDIDDMISLMRRLSFTWREARRGMNVLISLRSEWLPDLSHSNETAPPPPAAPAYSHVQGDVTSTFGISSGSGSGLGTLAAGSTGANTGNGDLTLSSMGGLSMGVGMLNPNPPTTDLTGELHDWLMNQDFYQTMFTNVAGNGWATEGVDV